VSLFEYEWVESMDSGLMFRPAPHNHVWSLLSTENLPGTGRMLG
jgi:hypothetical protein